MKRRGYVIKEYHITGDGKCPKCGESEGIIKYGRINRRGMKVQRYLCTAPKCGYAARGSEFGLPEEVVDVDGSDKEDN